jgi:hypothetical protein
VPEPRAPPLPNEIIGLIVDELRGDIPALRACSTVSILLYSFCKRHLYCCINLDTPEKVDGFVLTSENADLPVLRCTHTLSLGVAGMASWRCADNLVLALRVFAKRASIECLTLKEVKFTLVSPSNVAGLVETMGVLSRTVTKLKISNCLFIRRGDIESLIRSFPLCKSLRLRRCSWQSTRLAPIFSSLPPHTVSLDELEITTRKAAALYDLSEIVEREWLDTTGLKSLTYSVIENLAAVKLFSVVKDCQLDDLRVSCRNKESYPLGTPFSTYGLRSWWLIDVLSTVYQALKRVIPHVKSFTIACDGVGALWSLALFLRNFRVLPSLKYLTVATMDPISQVSPFWGAIDAICGSGRVYDSLQVVEFYFCSPHPVLGPGYVRRGELRGKLPCLTGLGMVKVSDPNAYVLRAQVFFGVLM